MVEYFHYQTYLRHANSNNIHTANWNGASLIFLVFDWSDIRHSCLRRWSSSARAGRNRAIESAPTSCRRHVLKSRSGTIFTTGGECEAYQVRTCATHACVRISDNGSSELAESRIQSSYSASDLWHDSSRRKVVGTDCRQAWRDSA